MAGSTTVEATSLLHATLPLAGREPGTTQLHVLRGIMELFRDRGSPGCRNTNWGNRPAHRNLGLRRLAASHPPLSQAIIQADGYRNEGTRDQQLVLWWLTHLEGARTALPENRPSTPHCSIRFLPRWSETQWRICSAAEALTECKQALGSFPTTDWMIKHSLELSSKAAYDSQQASWDCHTAEAQESALSERRVIM